MSVTSEPEAASTTPEAAPTTPEAAPTTPVARSRIQRVESDDRKLVVLWADDHKSTFHFVWLRESCTCSECGDAIDNRKRLQVADIPPDIAPSSVRVDHCGRLLITWASQDHKSVYDPGWLRAHCYSAIERARRRHQPILWGAELSDDIPEIGYRDVMAGDAGQLRMLEMVRDYGIALLREVPPVVGSLEQMAALIGYVREFGYGRVYDIVWNDEQKSIANSKEAIGPHTDEPFRYRPPGVSLFHCLKASSDGGGQSILVDGFNAVAWLRREDPDAVEILSRIPQTWHMTHIHGEDYQADGRLICLDTDGNVIGVRFNDRCHAPLDLPEELVEPFYAALRKLGLAYRNTEFWLTIPLKSGDLLVYDNERVLHGRRAFKGDRYLRLCAVERDEFHSRIRKLSRRLGKGNADLVLPAGVGV